MKNSQSQEKQNVLQNNKILFDKICVVLYNAIRVAVNFLPITLRHRKFESGRCDYGSTKKKNLKTKETYKVGKLEAFGSYSC